MAVLTSARAARAEGEYYDGKTDLLRHRGYVIGADLEGALPVDTHGVGVGGGGKLRGGAYGRVGSVHLVAEVGYGFERLVADEGAGKTAYDLTVNRAFAGFRVGWGRVVVPTVYLHAAYGWLDASNPRVHVPSGVGSDIGVALDFHFIEHYGFGVHAELAGIVPDPTPSWLAFGVHVERIF